MVRFNRRTYPQVFASRVQENQPASLITVKQPREHQLPQIRLEPSQLPRLVVALARFLLSLWLDVLADSFPLLIFEEHNITLVLNERALRERAPHRVQRRL